MSYLYTTLLYNPLLNILIFFYNTIAFGDFGLAIIFLAIFVRILLFPLFQKSAHHQTAMQRLQPHLKRIEEKHKGNREKRNMETMALYKEHNVNPLFSFLLLLQLPIIIAIYGIFLNSLKPDFFSGLYSFVSRPAYLNTSFLGLINLSGRSILIVGLSALAQYVQGILSLPKAEKGHEQSTTEKVGRQMTFIAPFMTLIVFYNLSAAVSLYWFVATVFSVFQQIIINRKHGEHGTIREKSN